ncbi:hypothetical protein ACFYW1_08810 [Streptomyces sp. NPDC002669]|uniref:hypothetical protein n=1 Tax=unclassified Streptomyces TaxID=2593676 RepID=UPI0036C13117
MATLHERQRHRRQILRVVYTAAEGNRLLGIPGAALNHNLHIPEQDLASACPYLAGEGFVTVDWEPGNAPAMVSLTHQGIRVMEAEEEEGG